MRTLFMLAQGAACAIAAVTIWPPGERDTRFAFVVLVAIANLSLLAIVAFAVKGEPK